MKLPDVNIWLALTLSGHSQHPVARSWLDGQEALTSIFFCRATQQGLVRLLTTVEVLAGFGIPPLTNRTIAITKGTALASVVAVSDILGAAHSGVSHSFNPSPLTFGALAYLVLFFPVVILGRWIETRFAWKR